MYDLMGDIHGHAFSPRCRLSTVKLNLPDHVATRTTARGASRQRSSVHRGARHEVVVPVNIQSLSKLRTMSGSAFFIDALSVIQTSSCPVPQ